MIRYALALVALAAGALPAAAAERAAATVTCEPAAEQMSYGCMIMVTGRKSGEPVTAESLSVKADMPTMPMAHNLPPVAAMPVPGQPGMYMATIAVEMFGEWNLAIDVDGRTEPGAERVRDKVIVKQEFGEAHAGGAMPHGTMQHGTDEEGAESE